MSVRIRRALMAALLAAAGGTFALADVVVLKGGTVVPLKQAWVRRGNTAYLTRTDGTLLSVPVSEIDRDATARANAAAAAAPASASAPAAPASSPAEAAKAAKDGPKASVKITDADVSHPLELPVGADEKKDGAAAAPGGPRVELVDYKQEKNGGSLVVKGSLRNPGQGTAENVRMTVTALDEKGASIDATTATLSKGSIDSGLSVEFVATLANVGEKTIANLRFAPQWTPPKPPPAPTPRVGTEQAAVQGRAAAPTPRPTPFGQGTMFAPPVASAPSQPPADGKTGYIPGATSPDNQPKPPNR